MRTGSELTRDVHELGRLKSVVDVLDLSPSLGARYTTTAKKKKKRNFTKISSRKSCYGNLFIYFY